GIEPVERGSGKGLAMLAVGHGGHGRWGGNAHCIAVPRIALDQCVARIIRHHGNKGRAGPVAREASCRNTAGYSWPYCCWCHPPWSVSCVSALENRPRQSVGGAGCCLRP